MVMSQNQVKTIVIGSNWDWRDVGAWGGWELGGRVEIQIFFWTIVMPSWAMFTICPVSSSQRNRNPVTTLVSICMIRSTHNMVKSLHRKLIFSIWWWRRWRAYGSGVNVIMRFYPNYVLACNNFLLCCIIDNFETSPCENIDLNTNDSVHIRYG